MRSLVLGCATAIGLMALLAIIVVRSLPTDRPPTPDELRSIPDVALLYPDAVETARSDRPGAYAFFNDQLTEARTTYRADASAESVGAWYDAALTSDGWVRQPEFRSSGPSQPTSFWRWCHPEVDADLWLGINIEKPDGVWFTVRLVSQSRRATENCTPK